MVEIFDFSLKKTAILQNAYARDEDEKLNAVSTFKFRLPGTDEKTKYCSPYQYLRPYDGAQLYRFLSSGGEDAATSYTEYQCEHVASTLIDDVMFGAHVVGNIGMYTTDVINYVLNRQTRRNWALHECDFSRQFEYGWENENLLAALFSIPNRFVEPYMWVFDTSVYPWRLSLKRIDKERPPQFYARQDRNVLKYNKKDNASQLCTRLYCLGYGEGINQLTIADVNNGLPYIDAPQSQIDKYGLISRIWVDRRFEDAQSLLERGRAILDGLCEPVLTGTVELADLFEITRADIDRAELGRIIQLDDGTKTYITRKRRRLDVAGDIKLDIATKSTSIASSIADLADRQRVEQVYAQGATQLYAQSVQANATTQEGATLNFWIPDEMRIVNKVLVKISLDRFRSYSRSTSGGGGSTQASRSGGGGSTTSQSGGGAYTSTSTDSEKSRTSSSGGSSSPTSSSAGGYQGTTGVSGNYNSGQQSGTGTSHTHNIGPHSHIMSLFAHTHTVSISSHTHIVTIPAHAHTVDVPAHTHTVDMLAHSHDVNIPGHTHDIEQGIFYFGNPTSAQIFINNDKKADISKDAEMDITQYLLNSNGKIPRGSWIRLKVTPNDTAYVTIDLYVQGFVQSRGGATY